MEFPCFGEPVKHHENGTPHSFGNKVRKLYASSGRILGKKQHKLQHQITLPAGLH